MLRDFFQNNMSSIVFHKLQYVIARKLSTNHYCFKMWSNL